jgi:hypothetical protein
MQNTPPVARGGFLWAVGQLPGVTGCRKAAEAVLTRVIAFVKERFRTEEWTEWAPGVLESLGADELPVSTPVTLEYRAGLLLDLGMDFARVAEVLQVSQEELLRIVPAVDTRVLSVSQSVTTRVRRLKEESW